MIIQYEPVHHPRYKYRLIQDYSVELQRSTPSGSIPTYVDLWENGCLVIYAGYCWDGPSGPAIDTANFMRASLVHDALYQLIREGRLKQSMRRHADKTMRRIALEDGMPWLRAQWTYWAVRLFGKWAARK